MLLAKRLSDFFHYLRYNMVSQEEFYEKTKKLEEEVKALEEWAQRLRQQNEELRKALYLPLPPFTWDQKIIVDSFNASWYIDWKFSPCKARWRFELHIPPETILTQLTRTKNSTYRILLKHLRRDFEKEWKYLITEVYQKTSQGTLS